MSKRMDGGEVLQEWYEKFLWFYFYHHKKLVPVGIHCNRHESKLTTAGVLRERRNYILFTATF